MLPWFAFCLVVRVGKARKADGELIPLDDCHITGKHNLTQLKAFLLLQLFILKNLNPHKCCKKLHDKDPETLHLDSPVVNMPHLRSLCLALSPVKH